MKKVLGFAVAAIALFAACQKTEVVYQNDGPQEISLFAVNKVATKAPVSGTSFPENHNMQVAAYLAAGDGNTNGGEYFKWTEFVKQTFDSDEYWVGGQYWPISTSTLNFLCVSTPKSDANPSAGTATVTVSTPDKKTTTEEAQIVLSNNANNNQFDLMFAADQGTHTAGNEYKPVEMKFKHALSWINFTVKTNLTSETGYSLKVNSITLTAPMNGTLTLANSYYKSTTETEVETSNLTTSWSPETNYSVLQVPGASETELVGISSAASFGTGILVIPGNYTSDAKINFVINYTITPKSGTAQTFNYTHQFKPTWEVAKKYTYNITLNLEQIKVNPSVTEWTTVTSSESVNL